MLMHRFVGPPAPPVYEPRPLAGRLEEPEGEALWPLLIAMGLDVLSTETGLRPGETRINAHGIPITAAESNPLPGMQVLPGRLAWGVAEALAARRLAKRDPR